MSKLPPLLMTDEEVHTLTGYKRPAQQLDELKRQGYWRARRAPITGRVLLERAHYEAVCAGADLVPGAKSRRRADPEPQLSPA